MARQVDGTTSILKGSRIICRAVGRFGTARFAARTSPEFAIAVEALVVACQAFEALDDYPAEIDKTAPFGVGDEV